MDITADYLKQVKFSATLMVAQKARKMKNEGKDVIILAAGEPDFQTPDKIKQAAIEAINNNFTKYVEVDGIPALKKAIQHKFKRENNLDYNLDEIIVGTGSKYVIYSALAATLNPLDEVIIPTPYWVSYPEMVVMNRGVPVIVKTHKDNNFIPTESQLRAAISNKTKWILLNSPNNPSGLVYPKQDLQMIANIMKDYPQLHVLTDDIYEHIVFDGEVFHTLASVCPEVKDRVLTVNGFSKAFAMTGWRLGYAGGPKSIITAMNKIFAQQTSNATSMVQYAAITALTEDFSEELSYRKQAFQTRRDIVLKLLSAMPLIEPIKPKGAFYIYMDCSLLVGKTIDTTLITDDLVLCDALLEKTGVALVPGSPFGLNNFVRMSIASDTQSLEEACKRMQHFYNQLH